MLATGEAQKALRKSIKGPSTEQVVGLLQKDEKETAINEVTAQDAA